MKLISQPKDQSYVRISQAQTPVAIQQKRKVSIEDFQIENKGTFSSNKNINWIVNTNNVYQPIFDINYQSTGSVTNVNKLSKDKTSSNAPEINKRIKVIESNQSTHKKNPSNDKKN